MAIKIDGMTAQGPSVSVLRLNDERTREADSDFGAELLDQEEALTAAKKCRIRKSFQFSL